MAAALLAFAVAAVHHCGQAFVLTRVPLAMGASSAGAVATGARRDVGGTRTPISAIASPVTTKEIQTVGNVEEFDRIVARPKQVSTSTKYTPIKKNATHARKEVCRVFASRRRWFGNRNRRLPSLVLANFFGAELFHALWGGHSSIEPAPRGSWVSPTRFEPPRKTGTEAENRKEEASLCLLGLFRFILADEMRWFLTGR